MRHSGMGKLLISLLLVVSVAVIGTPPTVHGAIQYRLAAFPFYSQEGSTITLVFSVSDAAPQTAYQFDFFVRDPTTTWWKSNTQNYTTLPGEKEFGIIIFYPSPEFPIGAKTNLVGTYLVAVNQIAPVPAVANPVATSFFFIGMTDKTGYQRTETVSIVATGYSPGESVNVNIRTEFTLTVVYNHTTTASLGGQVSDSWYVPKNAVTNEGYVLTVTGAITSKSPADAQGFNVQPAIMSISSLSSSKSTYQRTETFSFSFQATYPSAEMATTGLGLVTLARPDGSNFTLTANYNSTTQTFVAKYKTSTHNQTGTWIASLLAYSYDDGFGNAGPATTLSTSPQLQPATFLISITAKSSFAAFEPIRFNATVQYPDASILQPPSGSVAATLSYSGGGYSVPIPSVFDNTLQLWTGTYNPQGNEPSGLWSLIVAPSDSAEPANSGSSTRAITIQNRPPIATFSSSAGSAHTGVSISFDATGSSDSDGSIVSYLWNFGDGSTGSGPVVSHSYSTPGTYTVVLTVTDNSGTPSNNPSSYIVTATTAPQTGENVPFPLYYFGIMAAGIAAILGGVFAFRRHKVTHARLKIDLDAVRTEAGRIENQEFFQSVKDQLKKDKDD